MSIKVGQHVLVNRDRDMEGRKIERHLPYEVFLFSQHDEHVFLKPHRGFHHLKVHINDIVSTSQEA